MKRIDELEKRLEALEKQKEKNHKNVLNHLKNITLATLGFPLYGTVLLGVNLLKAVATPFVAFCRSCTGVNIFTEFDPTDGFDELMSKKISKDKSIDKVKEISTAKKNI